MIEQLQKGIVPVGKKQMKGGDGISQVSKKLLIIGFILTLIMGVSGVYALDTGTSSQSDVSVGNIDIKITEYTLNSTNEEVAYNKQTMEVNPGQEISLIEKVKNLCVECYVRASIAIEGINVTDITQCIKGISSDWQKIGDYYYYKNELATNDEVKIFDTVKIPEDLPNGIKQIKLKVVVEAVQAQNFEPNYNLEDPWNGLEIQKSIYSNYSIDEETNKLTIEYEDGADKYITTPDDFLQDLSKMMPGDTIQKQIRIKNTDKDQAEFFVAIDTDDLTTNQKELLKNIPVKITNKEGTVIYEGSLAGVQEGISLGIYRLNQEDILTIQLKLPKEAPNEYEGLLHSIKWKFYAKYKEQRSIAKILNPKTGDLKFDLSLLLFFTSAIGLVIVLALMHVERKKNI